MACAELAQQPVHAQPGQRVERAEGLVKQEQPGPADERAGQRHALGLAAGQRARPRVGAAGDADLLQGRERLGLAGLGHADQDVAPDSLPGQQAVVLEGHGPLTRNRDVPVGVGVLARQGAQQRGLPGAGGAEQRDQLAVAELQVDPGQHGALAEAATVPADADHRIAVPGRGRAGSCGGLSVGAYFVMKLERHDSVNLSISRTRMSVASPSRLYTMRPTKITSVCMRFWALVIR